MRMFASFGLFMTLAALVAVTSAEDKKDAFDASKLVGKWTIVSGTKNGAKASENVGKSKFDVTKDTMTLIGDENAKFVFKYTIDAKTEPVSIDLEMTESPFGAGMKAKGIIELKGDDLKLCYGQEERPKKFDGEKAFLFILKKADKK